jgi:hypothetical protein
VVDAGALKEIVFVDAPVLHEYVGEADKVLAVKTTEVPSQTAPDGVVNVTVGGLVVTTATEVVALQPPVAVTVTVYIPATKPVGSCIVLTVVPPELTHV